MVSLRALHLALHQASQGGRQGLPERLAVGAQSGVLATFALVQYGVVVVAAQRAAYRHPSAVQGAAGRAAVFRLAAQAQNLAAQFCRGVAALLRAFEKQGLQIGRAGMFRAGIKAVLSIAAGFDQVVQGVDHVVVVLVGGSGAQPAVHPFPRGTRGGAGLRPGQGRAAALRFPAGGEPGLAVVEFVVVERAVVPAQFIGRSVVVVVAAGFVIRLACVVVAPPGFFVGGVDRLGGGLAGQPTHHRSGNTAYRDTDRPAQSAVRGAGQRATGRANTGAHRVGSGLVGDWVTVFTARISVVCHLDAP